MSIDLLLINSPTDNYSHIQRADYYTLPPLGLGSIATTCEQKGFQVAILDAERLGLAPRQIVDEVKKLAPKFVGLNLLPSNYTLVRQIAHKISDETNARIVFGGPYATTCPEQIMLDNPFAFAVVRGEGEIPVLSLLEEQSRETIPGVSFIKQDKICISNTIYQLESLDILPEINRSFFVDDPHQTGEHLEAVVITSRGCPFECIYCGAGQVAGHKLRVRSISKIVDEIEHLRERFGVDSIYFIDDLLFLDPRRITYLAQQLIDRNLRITWHGLARADVMVKQFDDHLVRLLADSGCTQIAFGIESGTARIQKMIRKNLNLHLVREATQLCSRFGIETKGYFMIGFPDETEAEMRETIRFAAASGVNTAFFFGVRAFPGTKMYESLLAAGRTVKDLDEYIQLSNLITDPATREGLQMAGIDPDGLVKYNVLNSNPITTIGNERLIDLLRTAYREFYVSRQL